jgi:xanthine dehydrogenase YagS FAD-binding subunit
MKAFEWVSPASVGEAVSLLKNAPAAKDLDDAARPIAGGQDLLTTMKEYLTRPTRVVNLKGIRGLDRIEPDGKGNLRRPRTRSPRRRSETSARSAATSASARAAGTTASKRPSV